MAAALLVGLAGCTSAPEAAPGPSTPPTPSPTATTTLPTAAPEQVGLDPDRLAAAVRRARAQGSSCFVVVREGRVVAEHYWGDGSASQPAAVFSVTKSAASTLVGIAQSDGDLDVDDPAAAYVPAWRGTPAEEVTVRNLLANDSGREWSPESDYSRLVYARNRTAYAVGLAQEHPPGQVWAYNNAAIQTLDRVLRSATGEDPADFASERLFAPLGMADTRLTADAGGRSTGMAFGMESTCLDLARFGLLFQQEGRWGDDQLVPASWVREATGRSSQGLNSAYGLLWWLNRAGPVRAPIDQATPSGLPGVVRQGRLVPGAPADLYAALGLGGQVVMVHPGSATVVVRLGAPVLSDLDRYTLGDAARVLTGE